MKMLVCATAALVLAGCASQSSNMGVGSDMSYASLRDQREAAMTVKEYASVPAGATVLGTVDASRCHRNTLDATPNEQILMTDLKVAAYVRGADGVADVQQTKESGLLKNCWYIVTARATAFTLQKK